VGVTVPPKPWRSGAARISAVTIEIDDRPTGVAHPQVLRPGFNERTFRCDDCGFECDRDLNAARNLEKYAESFALFG
jgi:transposase